MEVKQPKPIDIVLASSSKYRARLLQRLEIEFRQVSPNIDERALPNESPVDFVKRLSIAKAFKVASSAPESWIISSDQAAIFDQEIIGKPLTHEKAVSQLSMFSEKRVTFSTGICVYNRKHDICLYERVDTQVYFKALGQKEIETYLKADTPYDCAGSFKIESKGVALFERVNSNDPTALEGLPLITLCRLFEKAGIQLVSLSQHSFTDRLASKN